MSTTAKPPVLSLNYSLGSTATTFNGDPDAYFCDIGSFVAEAAAICDAVAGADLDKRQREGALAGAQRLLACAEKLNDKLHQHYLETRE